MTVAVIEISILGSLDPGLVAVVAVLFAALGLGIAAVVAAQEAIVARFGLGGLPAALVRGAGMLLPLVLVSRTLFEGARAAQLPGAEYGMVWVPALGYIGTVAALAGGRWFASSRGRRRSLAVALVVFVAAIELGNRRLFRSEYPDIHGFLAAVSCIGLSLAWWLASGIDFWRRWSARRAVIWLLACAAVGGALTAALVGGLRDRESRFRLATHGTHARHLARVLRGVLDADGDGFSSVLGGGDCDDGNAAIYPGAAEVYENGVDEDCDGADLARPAVPPDARQLVRVLADWLESGDVLDLLERTRSMNVLIVALDALRADALLSESGPSTMPRTSALATESVVFRRAFAPASGTDLSVSSLIAGRIDPFVTLEQTLPEAMRETGRYTAAVLPSEMLRYAGRVLMSRGIDDLVRYVNDRGQRDVGRYTTTAEVTRLGLAALERASTRQPFYMWLHYFDIHEHLQVDNKDRDLSAVSDRFDLNTRAGKYAALTAVADRGVGRILDALAARGLVESTIVVVMSDHGESLGEDRRLPDKHGRFVYNALTHVPLLVRVPGLRPQSVDIAVSLVDVFPTLTHLAGARSLAGADGQTLLPLLVAGAPEQLRTWNRPIVMHDAEQWGVIDWPIKLMVRPAENLTELYDLSRDFGETRNLFTERPEEVSRLKAIYATFPEPSLDRTRAGRRRRDELARPPSKK